MLIQDIPDALPEGEPPEISMPEEEFAELAQEIVDDFAPRVFALIEEYGERVDGAVFGWGAEFEERAAVLSPQGHLFAICSSADGAYRLFSRCRTLRLVWPCPHS